MDRRRFLRAVAGAGALAVTGCLADDPTAPGDGGSTDAQTDAESPTDHPTTADESGSSHERPTATPSEAELTVELDALQPALVELHTDYYQLVTGDGRQYLALTVTAVSGPPPSRSTLAFRFDGVDHTPRTWDQIPARGADGSDSEQYPGENGSGWVVFDLPETGDASDAALVWPGGEWRPGERLRRWLETPLPPLSLEGWRGPETVPLDGTTAFELTVRNEGDYAGWFVGGINADGWYPHRPVARISRQVSPGETVSWEVPGEAIELPEADWAEDVGDGETDIEYELLWPDGNEWKSVRVVDG